MSGQGSLYFQAVSNSSWVNESYNEENVDFKNFSENISDTNKTNKVSKEYDEVLDDEKYEKYIIDKKIVKENLENE